MKSDQPDLVVQAHAEAAKILQSAIKDAKSPKEFQKNLQFAQVLAQRLLAILIFNAATKNKKTLDSQLELVGLGIKQELDQLNEAAKNPKNLQSIDVEFEEGAARDQH